MAQSHNFLDVAGNRYKNTNDDMQFESQLLLTEWHPCGKTACVCGKQFLHITDHTRKNCGMATAYERVTKSYFRCHGPLSNGRPRGQTTTPFILSHEHFRLVLAFCHLMPHDIMLQQDQSFNVYATPLQSNSPALGGGFGVAPAQPSWVGRTFDECLDLMLAAVPPPMRTPFGPSPTVRANIKHRQNPTALSRTVQENKELELDSQKVIADFMDAHPWLKICWEIVHNAHRTPAPPGAGAANFTQVYLQSLLDLRAQQMVNVAGTGALYERWEGGQIHQARHGQAGAPRPFWIPISRAGMGPARVGDIGIGRALLNHRMAQAAGTPAASFYQGKSLDMTEEGLLSMPFH